MPCARATRATDAPGASVSSTTPRRSAILRRRRLDSGTTVPLAKLRRRLPVWNSPSSPRGHDHPCPDSEDVLLSIQCPDGQDRTLTQELVKRTQILQPPVLSRPHRRDTFQGPQSGCHAPSLSAFPTPRSRRSW